MQLRRRMTIFGLFLLSSLTAASIIPSIATRDVYKAIYDFASQAAGEVDLRTGETVTVLQQDASGWWLVASSDGSMRGWTPGSYLSKVSSGLMSSTKAAPSSTDNKNNFHTSKTPSSSPKTSKSSSTPAKRSSTTSRHTSTSSSSSVPAKHSSTSSRHSSRHSSTSSSPSSSSSSSSSSSKRWLSSSLSTHVDPFIQAGLTSQSSLPSPSSSNTPALGQGSIKDSDIKPNSTYSAGRFPLGGTAPAIAPLFASTTLSSFPAVNITQTLPKSSVSPPTTPSAFKPMNINNADLYKMASITPALAIVSGSSESNIFPTMTPKSSDMVVNGSFATGFSSPSICLLDCDPTPTPTSTSSADDCLINCTPTSSALPSSSISDCLVNCGSASSNSSFTNTTIQANPALTNDTAVPVQCADPGGVNGVTMDCWNALGMSRYINEWILRHQGMCHAATPFAQCFLQVLDAGMNDCVSISSGTCPPPSWIQFKDHNMSIRDFYVAYNIYAVWTFFNSYYLAIGNARSAASDSVASIVSLLNPPKTNDAELSNINFALAIGLTFLKIEGFVSPVTEALVGVVVNAARQVPQVARYLFPGPPGDTKFTQLGQISNQMGTLTDNLQNNVAIALSVIQNDTTTFLSFTGSGAFSNNPVVQMDKQSDSLLTALNTYVISLCLQANNWQISRAIDTDVNQLMANGTQMTWNITDCGTGYDPNSICGQYYWNKTADVSYTLTNTDDMFRDPQPIMQQFFANWTTPELLFDGALQCQMAKGTGNPNISPTAGVNDVTSTPCLSSVKICTWDLNPSHFGTQYEYTDCDVQAHFATQGCSNCDATTDFCTNVPSSYLGGYLLNSEAQDPQYVYCDDSHTLISTN